MKTVRILGPNEVPTDKKSPSVNANSVTSESVQKAVAYGNAAMEALKVPLRQTYQSYIHALVRDILGRDSTPVERQTWTEQLIAGTPTTTVALCLLYSVDYRFFRVRKLFERTFKRAPSWTELQTWADQTNQGKTFERIWTDMLLSDEYQKRNGQTHDSFIRALFRDILDRRPESQEVESWRGLLDAFVATRESLVDQFLHSDEHRLLEIRSWHQMFLGKGVTAVEGENWLRKWQDAGAPEKILSEIFASTDYFIRRLRQHPQQ